MSSLADVWLDLDFLFLVRFEKFAFVDLPARLFPDRDAPCRVVPGERLAVAEECLKMARAINAACAFFDQPGRPVLDPRAAAERARAASSTLSHLSWFAEVAAGREDLPLQYARGVLSIAQESVTMLVLTHLCNRGAGDNSPPAIVFRASLTFKLLHFTDTRELPAAPPQPIRVEDAVEMAAVIANAMAAPEPARPPAPAPDPAPVPAPAPAPAPARRVAPAPAPAPARAPKVVSRPYAANDDCVICMERLGRQPACLRCASGCGHWFHQECLGVWARQNGGRGIVCSVCQGDEFSLY